MDETQAALFDIIQSLNSDLADPVTIDAVRQRAKRASIRPDRLYSLLQELEVQDLITLNGEIIHINDSTAQPESLDTDDNHGDDESNQDDEVFTTHHDEPEDQSSTEVSYLNPLARHTEAHVKTTQTQPSAPQMTPFDETDDVGINTIENYPTEKNDPTHERDDLSNTEAKTDDYADQNQDSSSDMESSTQSTLDVDMGKSRLARFGRNRFRTQSNESLMNLDASQAEEAKSLEDMMADYDMVTNSGSSQPTSSSTSPTVSEQETDSPPSRRSFRSGFDASKRRTTAIDDQDQASSPPVRQSFRRSFESQQDRGSDGEQSAFPRLPRREDKQPTQPKPTGLDGLNAGVRRPFGPKATPATPSDDLHQKVSQTERIIATYDIDLSIGTDEAWIQDVARTIRTLNENIDIQGPQDVIVLKVSLEVAIGTTDDELTRLKDNIDLLAQLADLPPDYTRVEWKTRLIK